jgi:hypothetical protein
MHVADDATAEFGECQQIGSHRDESVRAIALAVLMGRHQAPRCASREIQLALSSAAIAEIGGRDGYPAGTLRGPGSRMRVSAGMHVT